MTSKWEKHAASLLAAKKAMNAERTLHGRVLPETVQRYAEAVAAAAAELAISDAMMQSQLNKGN